MQATISTNNALYLMQVVLLKLPSQKLLTKSTHYSKKYHVTCFNQQKMTKQLNPYENVQ
jgi:hypothetical protein